MLTLLFVIPAIYLAIIKALECDTSWTDISPTFQIPIEIDSLFIPFKLSNYLFIIGTSSNNNNVLIYYHSLNNYTSLLSSLYDKSQIDYKSFQFELNKYVKSNPLNWHLLSSKKQLFSQSNDSLYPFLSYPMTSFVDKSSNDIYIISPIDISTDSVPMYEQREIWKLHINIKTSSLLSASIDNDVDISYYWENIADLLYSVSSPCIIYDEWRDIIFIFGGIDAFDGKTTNKVQAFSLTNYTMMALSDMISPRRLSACSLFNDDFIYVFGGNINDHYGTIEQYDIINDEWIQLNDDEIIFPFPRYATSAVQLKKHDLIYIVGGLISNDAATTRIGIFDPVHLSLEICRNQNHTLPINRGAATSIAISDTIWVFGGYSGQNMQFNPTITIGISYNEYLYDIQHWNDNNASISITDRNDLSETRKILGLISFDIALIALIAILIICAFCCYFIRFCLIQKTKHNNNNNNNNNNNHSKSIHFINSRDLEIMKSVDTETSIHSIGHQEITEMTAIRPTTPTYTVQNSKTHNNHNNNNNHQHRIQSSSGTHSNTLQIRNRSNESVTISSYSIPKTGKILNTPSINFRTSSSKKKRLSHPNRTSLLAANNLDTLQKQRVIQWLKDEVGLAQYLDTFFIHGFDRMSFIENMIEDDLIDMNIKKIGHRKRILQQIKIYKKQEIKTKKCRKNNSIAQTLDIAKTYNGRNNHNIFTKNQNKSQSRSNSKRHRSLQSIYSIDEMLPIQSPPHLHLNQLSSTSIFSDKSFDSSELYLSDGDGGDDELKKDGDAQTGDNNKKTTTKKMIASGSLSAIHGSDDNEIQHQHAQKFIFNPKQNRRNRTRRHYKTRKISNISNASSLSITSCNVKKHGLIIPITNIDTNVDILRKDTNDSMCGNYNNSPIECNFSPSEHSTLCPITTPILAISIPSVNKNKKYKKSSVSSSISGIWDSPNDDLGDLADLESTAEGVSQISHILSNGVATFAVHK